MRFPVALKRHIGLRGVILVVVALICVLLVGFNLFRTKMIGQFFATMQQPAVAVSTVAIEPVTWTPEISAIGTLSAAQGVDVATQVAGVVKTIAFKANDNVEQGQLLVQIDDAIERADVLSAEAALSRDSASLERAERLRRTGVSSEASLDDAQSAIAASESALAKIQAVLDQKAIEAPFAGVIGIPKIEAGQYIQPGTVIATLQQLDTLRVDFTVPEQEVAALTLGQDATFGLTEVEFPYRGTITGIDPKIDPASRLISVRAELSNPDGDLRPGQFVRVRVALPEQPDVIALPQTAVVTSLYGDYVYAVEAEAAPQQGDAAASPTPAAAAEASPTPAPVEAAPTPSAGNAPTPAADDASLRQSLPAENAAAPVAGPGERLVAKQVFVKIGRTQGNLVQINEGLKPGQTIITSGQNKLANNAAVTVNNAANPATAAQDDGGTGQ